MDNELYERAKQYADIPREGGFKMLASAFGIFHKDLYDVYMRVTHDYISSITYHSSCAEFNGLCDGFKRFLEEKLLTDADIAKEVLRAFTRRVLQTILNKIRMKNTVIITSANVMPTSSTITLDSIIKYENFALLLGNKLIELNVRNVKDLSSIENEIKEYYENEFNSFKNNLVEMHKALVEQLKKDYEERIKALKGDIKIPAWATVDTIYRHKIMLARGIASNEPCIVYIVPIKFTIKFVNGRLLKQEYRKEFKGYLEIWVSKNGDYLRSYITDSNGEFVILPHCNDLDGICFGNSENPEKILTLNDIVRLKEIVIKIMENINTNSMYRGWSVFQELEDVIDDYLHNRISEKELFEEEDTVFTVDAEEE